MTVGKYVFHFVENNKTIYSTMGDDTFLEVITPDTKVQLPGKKDNYRVLAVNKIDNGLVTSYNIPVEVV